MRRWEFFIFLFVLMGVSSAIIYWLGDDSPLSRTELAAHDPDFYMEDFTTLTMNQDGTPKNRLKALYMAHYPLEDTSELIKPTLEIFRETTPPVIVTSDKAWVTSDNQVILMRGNVNLLKFDQEGNQTLKVITTDVRVLVDEEYAETDQHATLIGTSSVTNAEGLRAYLQDDRLELLNNVQTQIDKGEQTLPILN